MAAAKPHKEHSRAARNSKQSRPLLDQLPGPWFARSPIRRTGAPRFVMVHDLTALAIMRTHFAHPVTFPVLWAIFWRQQTAQLRDLSKPTPISIEELVQQTGYARSSVFLGLDELKERDMIDIAPGGGRHKRSTYRLTALDRWLL